MRHANRAPLSPRSRNATIQHITRAAGLALAAAAATAAANAGIITPPGSPIKTWNDSTNDNWHTAANWTPAGVPISGDSALILNADQNLFLTNSTNNLASLYVGMNRSLSTNGHALRVHHAATTGFTTINGIDSRIFVPSNAAPDFELDTNTLTIENDATLQIAGGSVLARQQLTADTGGRVVGHGLLRVSSANPAALNLFNAEPLNISNGDLSIQLLAGGSFAPPQTIQLLQPDRALSVNAPLFSPIRDLIIGQGCSVEFHLPWSVEGRITAQPGQANNATIVDNAPLTLDGEIRVNSGNLIIETETDLNITSDVRLPTNILETKSLRFTNSVDSFPGSFLSVGFNASLILDGPVPALWQGQLNAESGTITANVPQGFWTFDGTMNLTALFGVRPTINGSAATRVTGNINSSGTGFNANAPLILLNDANLTLTNPSTQLIANDLIVFHPTSDTLGSGSITINPTASAFIATSADIEVDVTNHGQLNAGLSGPQIGYAYIEGNLTQSATGTIVAELAGTSPLLHDVYETAGTATINGTIHIALTDGFLPTPGDTFQVIQSNQPLTGTFAAITGEPGFIANYLPNAVILQFVGVIQPCAADLNNDGLVNSDDLGILLGAFGTSPDGDLDNDNDTDSDDLGLLLGAFGSPC